MFTHIHSTENQLNGGVIMCCCYKLLTVFLLQNTWNVLDASNPHLFEGFGQDRHSLLLSFTKAGLETTVSICILFIVMLHFITFFSWPFSKLQPNVSPHSSCQAVTILNKAIRQ